MRAALAAMAGIGGSAAVVYVTSILPLPLLLRAGHWFPFGDPRLVVLAAQALCLGLVLVVLRVPALSLLRGWPPRQGVEACAWLTLGAFLFSLLVSAAIASASGPAGPSDAADILARWAREFPSTGVAGHLAYYAVFVPTFEELLYRALILGYLLRLLPPWLALVVSTLLFAAGHPSWFFSGLIGVAYGLLYLRFRSLWLCVLAHGAHNLVASSGATLLAAHLHDLQFSMPTKIDLLLLQVTGAFLALGCLAMFLRRVFTGAEGGLAALLLGPRAVVAPCARG